MSAEQIMQAIEQDRIFYDQSSGGATFSGGEPLFQPHLLEALLTVCKKAGIHTALDTCGYAPAKVFDRLAGLTDLILFDLKLADGPQHIMYTGVDNQIILRNFETACNQSIDLRVRLPLVPGITDTDDNIQAIGRMVGGQRRSLPVDLLPYHRIGEHKYASLGKPLSKNLKPYPSQTEIEQIRSKYQEFGLAVNIEGIS